jgi:hypothetical protein
MGADVRGWKHRRKCDNENRFGIFYFYFYFTLSRCT